MPTAAKPKINLRSFKLSAGSHESIEQGACVMELVAYLAGEEFSDTPACACRVITKFLIRINDACDDENRQFLKPYIRKVIGTRANTATERKRAFLCADFAVRVAAPRWFREAKLDDWAIKMESVAPIVDKATSEAARTVVNEAQAKARASAAYASASSAAYASAAYAASSAAYASAAYASAAYAASSAYAYAASSAYAYAASSAYASAAYAMRQKVLRDLRPQICTLIEAMIAAHA